MSSNQGARRDNLIDASIIVAFVGAIGVLGAAWFGTLEPAAQRVQQASTRTIDLKSQTYKALVDGRTAACHDVMEWFKDEKPNTSFSKEDQRAVLLDMRDRMKSCDAVSVPIPILIDQSQGAPSKTLPFGGGSTSGGGAGGNY